MNPTQKAVKRLNERLKADYIRWAKAKRLYVNANGKLIEK